MSKVTWRAMENDYNEWFVSRAKYISGSAWFIGKNQPRLARLVATALNRWEHTGRENNTAKVLRKRAK